MVFLLFLASLAVIYRIVPDEVSGESRTPGLAPKDAAAEPAVLMTIGLPALCRAVEQAGRGPAAYPAPAPAKPVPEGAAARHGVEAKR